MAAVVLLTGCIVIPVERHTTETHHHYYGATEEIEVVEMPATLPATDED